MSLVTSMYSGTSGLNSASEDLMVIGDNIANANTIGFKSARAVFEETLSQNLAGNTGQLGLGNRLQAIQKILTQGALTTTGLATDLAIQGPGMFMLRGNHNGSEGQWFTRAGQFTVDKDGYLVSLGGLKVQGFGADAYGKINSGVTGDLRVGNAAATAAATGTITLKGNLQADATTPQNPFDVNDPSGTSNFSTSVTVYDSLGKANQVDVYFRKSASGAWDFYALTDGANVTGGTAGQKVQIADGTLTFDSSGKLTSSLQNSNFNPAGAISPQTLSFNFGDDTGSGGTGLGGLTQFASRSEITFQNQDGYAAGALANIQVDGEGRIVGSFSNGQIRNLGQVAIVNFPAQGELRRVGGTLFEQTVDSGQPIVGTAGAGGREIVSGALEQSNVDLAQEFVRMIAAQRGFQANSKTISTADQLLAELMTLKR